MALKIAIPEPTCSDAEYNARSLPSYTGALEALGALPVIVSLNRSQEEVARILTETQGVLLPGSPFDVDPQRYGQDRIPECGPDDPDRTAVDELLLQDAFNLRKPILAICHGAQTLNVWLNGSLVQDIDTVLRSPVNHRPGRDVVGAHTVRVLEGSRIWGLANALGGQPDNPWVNSSHHQAIGTVGDRLRVAAVSTGDGVIEAVETTSTEHFVLGVQWHPERTFAVDRLSSAIFQSFVQAAKDWLPASATESVAERR